MFVSCLFVLLLAVHIRSDDHGANAVSYTKDLFNSAVEKDKLFVMFFAPWCGHCKRLAPTWDELAVKYNIEKREVTIGKVDCTVETELCSAHGVRGYPTVKFFNLNKEGEKYADARTIEAFSKFIEERLGKEEEVKEEEKKEEEVAKAPVAQATAENGLYVLTDANYDAHIATGHHFIKFYAPWCGHCQRMAPTWDELAKKVGTDGKVKIGKVDCTLNSATCGKNGVRGYPTLMWFTNGEKSEDYRGAREMADFEQFIVRLTSAEVEEKKLSQDGAVPAQAANDQGIVTLTDEDFKDSISEDFTLVLFSDDQKHITKLLVPILNRVALDFVEKPEILIAQVNCGDSVNLCTSQDAKGPYPTLRMYHNGALLSNYTGEQTVAAITKYLDGLLEEQRKKDEL
ncbi:hypothetical protein DPMN_183120 [Dreissena polymorpha]|uniref:Thioredoxin domain-containing protein n=2 Tax=Dreissena polymorpha TaxID=45954 RepID=A0A9D4DIH0_DREPO|nr:hypothetical protein DPMN_183120 [Dreissena polymorpha]